MHWSLLSVLKVCFQKSLYWSNPLFLSLVSCSVPLRHKRTCPWAIWCHWAAPWPRCTPKATWPSCPTPQWWVSRLPPPPRQTKTRTTTKITILSSLLFLLFFHSLYHTDTHTHTQFQCSFRFLKLVLCSCSEQRRDSLSQHCRQNEPGCTLCFYFLYFSFFKSDLFYCRRESKEECFLTSRSFYFDD